MSLTQSDKVTLTQYPALPSLCRVCSFSSDGKRWFVDFQLSFDFDGAINICSFCMENIVQVLGYISPVEAENLKEQVASLVVISRKLTEDNAKLNAGLDTVLKLRPSILSRSISLDEDSEQDFGEDADQLTFPIGEVEARNAEFIDEVNGTISGDAEPESIGGFENIFESTSKSESSSSDGD